MKYYVTLKRKMKQFYVYKYETMPNTYVKGQDQDTEENDTNQTFTISISSTSTNQTTENLP